MSGRIRSCREKEKIFPPLFAKRSFHGIINLSIKFRGGISHAVNITYVHAFVVENTNRATLQPIIQQFVSEGSRVITDELNAYNGLSELGYTHAVVNHGSEEYANGDVFTNSIEGFWSHFRRMILGCYHDVSDEHLQSYINEAVYRWNTRKMSESERFAHMFSTAIGIVCKWNDIKVGLIAA